MKRHKKKGKACEGSVNFGKLKQLLTTIERRYIQNNKVLTTLYRIRTPRGGRRHSNHSEGNVEIKLPALFSDRGRSSCTASRACGNGESTWCGSLVTVVHVKAGPAK